MNPRHQAVRRTAATTSIVLSLAALTALPAAASSDGGVQRNGKCSQGSDWSLRADPSNGRIRVEAENDSGIDGQHWTWRILHNGGVSASGSGVTQNGGSLKVQRLLINVQGPDNIGWRSTNTRSGEHCNGNLTY